MLEAMWRTLLALAPWMLLGMAIAGVLHVTLPRGLVRRRLSGRLGVPLAVAVGVPLPLCSCGVIPAGLGLKRDGASNGATVGFLISTPQTGVDSILVSASFLGWPFALFKVLSATVTGVVGGWLADAVAAPERSSEAAAQASSEQGGRRDAREGLDHALMILRSIWGWIVVGVVASAAIEVVVPAGFFAGLASYGALVPVLGALVISVPLYVCATASVPIAAALVASGMPAGAALVFLMAGPATNVATIGAIHRTLGRRALAVYLGTIVAGSCAAAFLFDFVLRAAPHATGHEHGAPAWWAVGSALVLSALIAWFAANDVRELWRRRVARRDTSAAIEVPVVGMNCQSCVSKLQRALLDEQGVASAVVTLEPARAVVRGAVDRERVRRVVESAGFSVGPS